MIDYCNKQENERLKKIENDERIMEKLTRIVGTV